MNRWSMIVGVVLLLVFLPILSFGQDVRQVSWGMTLDQVKEVEIAELDYEWSGKVNLDGMYCGLAYTFATSEGDIEISYWFEWSSNTLREVCFNTMSDRIAYAMLKELSEKYKDGEWGGAENTLTVTTDRTVAKWTYTEELGYIIWFWDRTFDAKLEIF